MTKKLLTLAITGLVAVSASAGRLLFVDMEADGRQLTESVSGSKLTLSGQHAPENIPGAAGMALRLDGYSSFASGTVSTPDAQSVTVSMWVAPETYPTVALDRFTDERIVLAGTLDKTARAGWAFTLGFNGVYAFECYSGGWPLTLKASDMLPTYEWSHLVAVIDGASGKAKLYRNGAEVASSNCMTPQNLAAATQLFIGKSPETSKVDVFNINSLNGLIDDIEIADRALSAAEVIAFEPENEADLRVPASRFAANPMRPKFHGMPGANWTNESHGMTYSDGRWHVFFQKNGNGPYMTRLHWGHISSENLCDWREEKIAIAPGESYDIKGCWSGCVFSDDVITGGKPSIIYTAVDYARAVIAQANPVDDSLIDWEKVTSNPIIDGRPAGLSDDFRDPYFFRNGDNAYIIVGSSSAGVGCTTLHRYDPASKTFSNDGKLFAKGMNTFFDGSFWEMPNVTDMGGGKWLFTVTPLNTSKGVWTQYRTGTIADDGTFVADGASTMPRGVELISKDGYGLLSPTIYQKDGKTIALGIVPDKVSGADNYEMGWAHCYSLPREWSLDENSNLVQKPYAGLRGLRSSDSFGLKDFELSGTKDITGVGGRQVEILGRFTVGANPFGFRFMRNSIGQGKLFYTPGTNRLTVDLTGLQRYINDNGSYNGVYTCTLPETIKQGEELTLNLFIDGSVLDIFVNDKWATSIRVFATAADADGLQAYSEGGSTFCRELSAWVLKSDAQTSVDDIFNDSFGESDEGPVDVFTLSGILLRSGVEPASALDGLPSGLYIVGGKKVICK